MSSHWELQLISEEENQTIHGYENKSMVRFQYIFRLIPTVEIVFFFNFYYCFLSKISN